MLELVVTDAIRAKSNISKYNKMIKIERKRKEKYYF